MRCETILIVYRPDPMLKNEVTNGARALFNRCIVKEKATRIYLAAMSSGGNIDVVDEKEGLTPCFSNADKAGLGVYMIFHHSMSAGNDFYGVSTELVVPNLANLVKTLGYKQIRKLAAVGCRTASRINKSALNTQNNWEKTGKDLFLARFCMLLAEKHNLTPLIRGWDDFVTICYEGNPEWPKDKVAEEGQKYNKGGLHRCIQYSEKAQGKEQKLVSRAYMATGWSDKQIFV